MPGPKMRPYAQGAGPIPNDEYGTGHMQVDPRYSRQTNMNIANQSMGDANLAGIQELYGSPNIPPAPYTEGIYPQDKGLNPATGMEFQMRGNALDSSVAKMRQLFGDESAAQILDEVMRVAASQDVNGPMAQPDFSRMPAATGSSRQPGRLPKGRQRLSQ